MILIAVVGLFLGVGIWAVKLARLSARYRKTEANYAQMEKSLTRVIGLLESSVRSHEKSKLLDERTRMRNRSLRRRFPMPELDLWIDYDRWIEEDKRWIEQFRQRMQHATLLRQKYQRAAAATLGISSSRPSRLRCTCPKSAARGARSAGQPRAIGPPAETSLDRDRLRMAVPASLGTP